MEHLALTMRVALGIPVRLTVAAVAEVGIESVPEYFVSSARLRVLNRDPYLTTQGTGGGVTGFAKSNSTRNLRVLGGWRVSW